MRAVAGMLPVLVLVAAACSSKRVLQPPNLNLVPHGSIGLFQFSVENAKGTLHEFATRRFEEYVLAAQSGIEVREFLPRDSTAAYSGDRSVPVIFFGHLKISDVKPQGGLVGLLPTLEAMVTAELSVWLVNTRTGGTLWRRSSRFTEKVGGFSLSGGQPTFMARDPNDAYGRLVNRLVYDVTYDVRSTWVKQ